MGEEHGNLCYKNRNDE